MREHVYTPVTGEGALISTAASSSMSSLCERGPRTSGSSGVAIHGQGRRANHRFSGTNGQTNSVLTPRLSAEPAEITYMSLWHGTNRPARASMLRHRLGANQRLVVDQPPKHAFAGPRFSP